MPKLLDPNYKNACVQACRENWQDFTDLIWKQYANGSRSALHVHKEKFLVLSNVKKILIYIIFIKDLSYKFGKLVLCGYSAPMLSTQTRLFGTRHTVFASFVPIRDDLLDPLTLFANLAPWDSILFFRLEVDLKGNRFADINEQNYGCVEWFYLHSEDDHLVI